MRTYTITEEQLLNLEAAVWGARFLSQADLDKYLLIIAAVKAQPPIDAIRLAKLESATQAIISRLEAHLGESFSPESLQWSPASPGLRGPTG